MDDEIRTRNRTLSTKLTAEEAAVVQAKARAAGQRLSTWSREKLLAEEDTRERLLVLLAEWHALRSVVLRLVAAKLADGDLSEQALRTIVGEAEAQKWERASRTVESFMERSEGRRK